MPCGFRWTAKAISVRLVAIVVFVAIVSCTTWAVSSESFQGVWTVERMAGASEVSALDQSQVDALIGTSWYLCPDEYSSSTGVITRKITYVTESRTALEFFVGFRTELTGLGISRDSVRIIHVVDQERRLVGDDQGILGLFLSWGEQSLIGMTGGAFFLLKKTAGPEQLCPTR